MQRFAKPYNPQGCDGSIPSLSANTEGAAKWLAIGLENRGNRKVRGSIPQSSAIIQFASIAQQVERLTCNEEVARSIRAAGSNHIRV